MKKTLYLGFIIIAAVLFSGCSQKTAKAPKESGAKQENTAPEKTDKPEPEKKPVPRWLVTETELFRIPQDHQILKYGRTDYDAKAIYFDASGTKFAYAAFKGADKHGISVISGQEAAWQSDEPNIYNNDNDQSNGHQVKPVKKGNKYFLIEKGKTLSEADSYMERATVSNDGKQFGYAITDYKGNWYAVVNGNKSARFDIIGPQNCSSVGVLEPCATFAFSEGKYAFIAKKGSQFGLVVNGKEGNYYDFIYSPMFSPKFDNIMFRAGTGGKQLVVIKGEEQKKYEGVYNLHYENNNPTFNALDGDRILLVKETYNPEFSE